MAEFAVLGAEAAVDAVEGSSLWGWLASRFVSATEAVGNTFRSVFLSTPVQVANAMGGSLNTLRTAIDEKAAPAHPPPAFYDRLPGAIAPR